MPEIKNGTYRAKARTWALAESSRGTPEVAVEFVLSHPDANGTSITWHGYLSDGAFARTIESLRICGWEKLSWRIIAGIVLAFAGLALALDPGGRGHDVTGVTLAFVGALGLGIVVAVSSRVIRARDSR